MREQDRLRRRLKQILPSAELEPMALPCAPSIRLLLLNPDFPQDRLSAAEVQRVMDNPLYWVFCWASGQVLAEFLLAQPGWVRGLFPVRSTSGRLPGTGDSPLRRRQETSDMAFWPTVLKSMAATGSLLPTPLMTRRKSFCCA